MTKALRPLLLLAGLLSAGLLLRLLPEGGATTVLRAEAAGRGPFQAAECVLLGAALCAVGVPRQVVAYVCGLAFGAWLGMALALAAQLIGCAADVAWARTVARDWAQRRLRGRLARLDARLSARPFAATLALRLLPVGNNLLLNLAAGLSRVPVLPFLAGSAVGYVPQTAVFALLGGGVRVGHAAQFGLAAALLLLASVAGAVVLRRSPVGVERVSA